MATQDFLAPALAGLGHKVGARVFQLSPMPRHLLQNLPQVLRLAEQLPLLRMLWPGPMVCRWNLNPLHDACS